MLFYWPPQPRVVPCAHVIQRLLSEGKYPACLINRKCVFLSASAQLMFHIFQWLWAESFGVLLGEPSVSVLRGRSGHRAFRRKRSYVGKQVSGDGEKGARGRRNGRKHGGTNHEGVSPPIRTCLANVLFEQRGVPLRKQILPGPLDSFHCQRYGNGVSRITP